MSRKSLEVSIEPKILTWARDGIGKGIPGVTKRTGLTKNALMQ
jgi:hypothetical protein